MQKVNKVQINIWIPEALRDQLKREVAKKVMIDPSERISISSLTIDIISKYFENLKETYMTDCEIDKITDEKL